MGVHCTVLSACLSFWIFQKNKKTGRNESSLTVQAAWSGASSGQNLDNLNKSPVTYTGAQCLADSRRNAGVSPAPPCSVKPTIPFSLCGQGADVNFFSDKTVLETRSYLDITGDLLPFMVLVLSHGFLVGSLKIKRGNYSIPDTLPELL